MRPHPKNNASKSGNIGAVLDFTKKSGMLDVYRNRLRNRLQNFSCEVLHRHHARCGRQGGCVCHHSLSRDQQFPPGES